MRVRGLVILGAIVLSGCGGLPPADCQLRAGALSAEAGWDPFGAEAMGGAVSWVGDPAACPPDLKVFTRSPNGSVVCKGPDEWCDRALTNAPLTVTPAQLREVLNDFETPPPEQ